VRPPPGERAFRAAGATPAAGELATTFATTDIGPALRLHFLPSEKPKTVVFGAYLRRDLDRPGAPEAAEATRFALLHLLLRRGSRSHPTLRALSRALEDLYGATLYTDVLKIGEAQVLNVGLEVANPKFLPGRSGVLEEAVALLAGTLLDPALDEATGRPFRAMDVEQEKKNLARTLAGLVHEKAAYACERCIAEMAPDEPFGLYEYGRADDLATLAPEDLGETHRQAVDRLPLDLFAAGDVEPDLVHDLVAARFGGPRRGDYVPRPAVPHPSPRPARVVVEERRVEQARLVLAYRSPIRHADERFPSLLFLNSLLGAFPHSRLFRVVREREGLCYQASSLVEKAKGVIVISLGIDVRHYERARALVEAQVAALAGGDATGDEMEQTARALARLYTTIEDSPARKANALYAMRVSGRQGTLADETAALGAVTREDVAAAAQGLWLDTVYLLRPRD